MADNYLEKKFEELREKRPVIKRNHLSLDTLLHRNRSYRGYDPSRTVTREELMKMVEVTTLVPSGKNLQALRYRLVTEEESDKVLPLIRMGAALPELHLPFPGTEPRAFLVVCSTVPENPVLDIDLGIAAQSLLLKAVEMGLNGLIIRAFDPGKLQEALGLELTPLLVIAIGKGAENIYLKPVDAGESLTYYRKDVYRRFTEDCKCSTSITARLDVSELAAYSKLPHTLTHAAGFNPSAWLDALKQAVSIMDDRYTYMEQKGLKKYDKGDLYVVIDEWANVFKNGGKDAYKMVLRLTSEGRAAKVHLIMATQVPKANIIPTEIRENFDSRICLRTANAIQSRVIMEDNGCESLPRYGQGFYVNPEGTELYNIPYVQQDELDRNIAWWADQVRKNG